MRSAPEEFDAIALRESISAHVGDALATNQALTQGAQRLLAGRQVRAVARLGIEGSGTLAFALDLDDGTRLEAPCCAQLDGPVAEHWRLAHLTPPPAALLAHAKASVRGRRIRRVLNLEIYDADGNVSFEIELDDTSKLEAPVCARLSGPVAAACLLAGACPSTSSQAREER